MLPISPAQKARLPFLSGDWTDAELERILAAEDYTGTPLEEWEQVDGDEYAGEYYVDWEFDEEYPMDDEPTDPVEPPDPIDDPIMPMDDPMEPPDPIEEPPFMEEPA